MGYHYCHFDVGGYLRAGFSRPLYFPLYPRNPVVGSNRYVKYLTKQV